MGEKVASIAALIVYLAIVATFMANPSGTAQVFDSAGRLYTNSITAAKH